MSTAAYKLVWEHSEQQSTLKLLLLAIAEHTDAQRFSWPSVPTLARMLSLDVDYTHKLIKQLVDSGEILHKRGGGRGRCSIYALALGLDATERAALNTVLQNSVIKNNQRVLIVDKNTAAGRAKTQNTVVQNSVLQNTVLQNTVLQSGKTLYYSLETVDENSAAGREESPQNTQEIHHEIHDDDDVTRTSKKSQQQPRHVSYLVQRGMFGAHLFAACDPDSTIASYDNMVADGWDNAGIVKQWKMSPPSRENIYERRQPETSSAERSGDRVAPTPQRARAARAGEPDYYTKRRA